MYRNDASRNVFFVGYSLYAILIIAEAGKKVKGEIAVII